MNGKFILGIVLLALFALTGVVNAGTTGNTDIQAVLNIPQPTLTLTITGSQSAWTMDHVGLNTFPGGYQITVTNVGYPDGYKVYVADKQLSGQIPGPAGHMCKWNAQGNAWSAPCLTNALIHGQGIIISGTNQQAFDRTTGDLTNANLAFFQTIDAADQNGNYRIVLTFTAIPN